MERAANTHNCSVDATLFQTNPFSEPKVSVSRFAQGSCVRKTETSTQANFDDFVPPKTSRYLNMLYKAGVKVSVPAPFDQNDWGAVLDIGHSKEMAAISGDVSNCAKATRNTSAGKSPLAHHRRLAHLMSFNVEENSNLCFKHQSADSSVKTIHYVDEVTTSAARPKRNTSGKSYTRSPRIPSGHFRRSDEARKSRNSSARRYRGSSPLRDPTARWSPRKLERQESWELYLWECLANRGGYSTDFSSSSCDEMRRRIDSTSDSSAETGLGPTVELGIHSLLARVLYPEIDWETDTEVHSHRHAVKKTINARSLYVWESETETTETEMKVEESPKKILVQNAESQCHAYKASADKYFWELSPNERFKKLDEALSDTTTLISEESRLLLGHDSTASPCDARDKGSKWCGESEGSAAGGMMSSSDPRMDAYDYRKRKGSCLKDTAWTSSTTRGDPSDRCTATNREDVWQRSKTQKDADAILNRKKEYKRFDLKLDYGKLNSKGENQNKGDRKLFFSKEQQSSVGDKRAEDDHREKGSTFCCGPTEIKVGSRVGFELIPRVNIITPLGKRRVRDRPKSATKECSKMSLKKPTKTDAVYELGIRSEHQSLSRHHIYDSRSNISTKISSSDRIPFSGSTILRKLCSIKSPTLSTFRLSPKLQLNSQFPEDSDLMIKSNTDVPTAGNTKSNETQTDIKANSKLDSDHNTKLKDSKLNLTANTKIINNSKSITDAKTGSVTKINMSSKTNNGGNVKSDLKLVIDVASGLLTSLDRNLSGKSRSRQGEVQKQDVDFSVPNVINNLKWQLRQLEQLLDRLQTNEANLKRELTALLEVYKDSCNHYGTLFETSGTAKGGEEEFAEGRQRENKPSSALPLAEMVSVVLKKLMGSE